MNAPTSHDTSNASSSDEAQFLAPETHQQAGSTSPKAESAGPGQREQTDHVLTLGRVVATPAAVAALDRRGDFAGLYVTRHSLGDFGDLDPEDWSANVDALRTGARVFSSYRLPAHAGDAVDTVWVITEADRACTTVLLPSDY